MQTIFSNFKGLLLALCLQLTCAGFSMAQCNVVVMAWPNQQNGLQWNFFAADSFNCVGPNATYTWDFGDGTTGSQIQATHTYPVTAVGTYNVCVTIQNQGVSWTQCKVISVGQSAACNYTVAGNYIPNTFNWYFGVIDSTQCLSPNATFSWNFGDNSVGSNSQYPSHTFPGPGFYMVCVTVNNNGATTTKCMNANVDSIQITPCAPVLKAIPTGGGPTTWQLSALDSAGCLSPNTLYVWSFGDGTSGTGPVVVHQYPANGTYTACVTYTSNGNTATRCMTINVNGTTPNIYITGHVFSTPDVCVGLPTAVEVIGIDNNTYSTFTVNNIQDSCFYFFQVQPDKKYVIRATPLNSAGGAYMPTYYGDQVFWSEATVIQPTENTHNLNILMQTSLWSQIGSGNGTLNGTVSGNGTTVTTSFNGNTITTTFSTMQAYALILNSNNQPIGFAVINADGTFSFPNLPNGQYFLRIEHPKVNSASVPVTITSAEPSVSVSVVATSTGIDVVTSNARSIKGTEVTVAPNPASHKIMITGTEGAVLVINMQGKVVLQTSGNELNIESLANGLYTIKASNQLGQVITTRFVKN